MLLAKSFGIESALIEEPDQLADGLQRAIAKNVPFLLEVRTRGDVPMPRTGYWDIADFLEGGNDAARALARAAQD
jgi:thiamine pyrophosphate-dependent acetolactate synthase large subunit-like protein